jgi:hypothetical protein
MRFSHLAAPATAVALTLLAATPAPAVLVEKLDLDGLVERAGSAVAVTVVAARPATVKAGGTELPVVVYSLRVEETLKGRPAMDAERVAQVSFLAAPEQTEHRGGLIHRSNLPELPTLRVGGRYLLVLTAPSALGLSSPVGLEQGVFRLTGKPGAETAVNPLRNAGLFDGAESLAPTGWTTGPVDYDHLAAAIRTLASR